MMEYKNYYGAVDYDDEAQIFHGEVLNLRDVITFQGKTVKELRRAFEESINDYLEWCHARGKEPEKPFSGKLMLRMDPQLHRMIAAQAAKRGQSLNIFVTSQLEKALLH